MANYKDLFLKYLDACEIKYTDEREYVVSALFGGENLENIDVYFFFDEDGDPIVQLRCWSIANFKGKEGLGIAACNKVNNKFRWLTFCIDDDGDVVASLDAYITEETCGDECYKLLKRMVTIVDEAYLEFERVLRVK